MRTIVDRGKVRGISLVAPDPGHAPARWKRAPLSRTSFWIVLAINLGGAIAAWLLTRSDYVGLSALLAGPVLALVARRSSSFGHWLSDAKNFPAHWTRARDAGRTRGADGSATRER